MGAEQTSGANGPWWREVTRYQWVVLAIASAGWVFDVFEGQLFVSLQGPMLDALVGTGPERELLFNLGLASFLLGGAVGGLVFGVMADRWGRRRTMALTILMYSVFTGMHALVENGWQLAGLRFLVGMGVGGEWAVAAAAVAEVFPPRARTAASGIFHASSVLGTYLAVAAGFFVLWLDPDGGWKIGFLLGGAPALLIFWVRASMRDPESWQAAKQRAAQDTEQRMGRLTDLFRAPAIRRHTLIATSLAVIGLATFWGTHIKARNLLQNAELQAQQQLPRAERDSQAPERFGLYGMLLATTGGGIGLLSFAPLSQRVGRRGAFLFFHLGGFVMVGLAVTAADSVPLLIAVLPVFGFFTLGMHAGYAVYFPELFPTRLRGTGAGFCFNTARIVAGPVLLGFAWLQGLLGDTPALGMTRAMLVLGCLFLVGAVLTLFAPETRGRPLPE
ncbi:MAG: MFS transporter [Gemmataceae bacterium]|nr:MFS transporter [Gemmataceae bacterium]